MKRILFALLAFSVLAVCSCNKKKVIHNDLYYSNDLENVKGWIDNTTIVRGNAHSGNYYSVTDSSRRYSFTFKLPVSSISDKPLKKADVTLWAYVKNKNFDGSVVTCIMRDNNNVYWNSSDLKTFCKKPEEWFKATAYLRFPANIEKTDKVLIYLWNVDGKTEIRMDDMEIQFYN